MKKTYAIHWTSRINKKHSGSIEVKLEDTEGLTLDEWGEKMLRDYMEDAFNGDIPANDSVLSYYIQHGAIDINTVSMLSIVRVIRDRSEIEDIDSKTKEKIQKLLNLSMSDNKNEAKVASQMAYKLMKKNSLTRAEIEGQEFVTMKLSPKGKRVTQWEEMLHGYVSRASGVLFTFHRGLKGNDNLPHIDTSLSLTGRERDVLNASYLIECYAREIEKMMKAKKKAEGISTKETNDYRLGLIVGIGKKIDKDKKEFFGNMGNEKLHDIVSVDSRIDAAKELFMSTISKRAKRRVGASYADGQSDAKKIVIRKATEDKTKKHKRLGV